MYGCLQTFFALERQLGGVMFWTLDTDDFRGDCYQLAYPLVTTSKKLINDYEQTVNSRGTYWANLMNFMNKSFELISCTSLTFLISSHAFQLLSQTCNLLKLLFNINQFSSHSHSSFSTRSRTRLRAFFRHVTLSFSVRSSTSQVNWVWKHFSSRFLAYGYFEFFFFLHFLCIALLTVVTAVLICFKNIKKIMNFYLKKLT